MTDARCERESETCIVMSGDVWRGVSLVRRRVDRGWTMKGYLGGLRRGEEMRDNYENSEDRVVGI